MPLIFLSQAAPQGEELKAGSSSGLLKIVLLLLHVCFSIKRLILPSGLGLLLIAWRLPLTTGRNAPLVNLRGGGCWGWTFSTDHTAHAPFLAASCATQAWILALGRSSPGGAHCACVLVSSAEQAQCIAVSHVRGSELGGGGGGARSLWGGGAGLLWLPFCWLHYWVIRALLRFVHRISSASGQA